MRSQGKNKFGSEIFMAAAMADCLSTSQTSPNQKLEKAHSWNGKPPPWYRFPILCFSSDSALTCVGEGFPIFFSISKFMANCLHSHESHTPPVATYLDLGTQTTYCVGTLGHYCVGIAAVSPDIPCSLPESRARLFSKSSILGPPLSCPHVSCFTVFVQMPET
ncbi:uncharacterized protein CLUP02_02165 [Colletotrichum lupini]|uniref:Uncharacterized protein n=1 Tax=Colletotrichum lupini TaxID=145971 RepID=A0A9Q8SDR6_9PEZI|nr:uncharacterized protein CLUP02_02165 [Colletotrichum lupini]UQC75511.1 hypothetical protein CLUP02_02165 [Colletotrichum lupini]